MSDIIDQGTGPTLVFLHGAGVDKNLWDPQIAVFAKNYRVVVPDLPGHGTVPAVDSVQQMAEHVRAQLTDLGIRRYGVIGLSLGGMVALEMAGRWPDEVTHLVMIESVPNVTENPALLFLGRALVTLTRFVNPKLFSLLPARQMGAETKDAAQYVKQALARMKARDNYTVLRAALAYDGRPHLSAISMPTLIMVGEKNTAMHKRAKDMSHAIEHCLFAVVPNAGHIANRDAPEFINNSLEQFLGSEA